MNARFQYVMIRGLILCLGLDSPEQYIVRLESSPSTRGHPLTSDDQSFHRLFTSFTVISSSFTISQQMVDAR
jgi:hypothetical protein